MPPPPRAKPAFKKPPSHAQKLKPVVMRAFERCSTISSYISHFGQGAAQDPGSTNMDCSWIVVKKVDGQSDTAIQRRFNNGSENRS